MLDLNCNSNLMPWKVLTPSTPKQTNLEANSFSFKSLYVIKEFMINKVRLLALDLKKIYCTFNSKGVQH
jgi:hypothetical protein